MKTLALIAAFATAATLSTAPVFADSTAAVFQNGFHNQAAIRQTGDNSHATIIQDGDGHVGSISQSGDNQSHILYQLGQNTEMHISDGYVNENGVPWTVVFGW